MKTSGRVSKMCLRGWMSLFFCDFERILHSGQALTRRPGDPLSIFRIARSMAGAVPGAVGRIPGEGTAQMGAGGAKAFIYSFLLLFGGKGLLQSQVEDGVAQIGEERTGTSQGHSLGAIDPVGIVIPSQDQIGEGGSSRHGSGHAPFLEAGGHIDMGHPH